MAGVNPRFHLAGQIARIQLNRQDCEVHATKQAFQVLLELLVGIVIRLVAGDRAVNWC
ncbi:MAG: hypothetical protein ACK55Z_28090 [bacterium]